MPIFTFACGCGHMERFFQQNVEESGERNCNKIGCDGMMFRTMGVSSARPMEMRDEERGKSVPLGLEKQLEDRARWHENGQK
jgi:hypothetical protein